MEAKGLTIVKEYEGRAISGTTDERPGFQLMLSEVDRIKLATLILWKTNTLSRDRYVLAIARKAIHDASCKVHLVAETISDEGPEGKFMEGLLESASPFSIYQ